MISIKDIFALLGRLGAPASRSYLRPGNWRPTGTALRNPADFHQSNRLEAAVLKRRRKAEKLQRDTLEAATNNWAHVGGRRCDLITASPIGSLNPFYIAK